MTTGVSLVALHNKNDGDTQVTIGDDMVLSSRTTTMQQEVVPLITEETYHVAGIPSWLQNLNETIYLCRPSNNNKAFSVERVCTHPPIFVLRNFLSLEECDIIRETVEQGCRMQNAQTLNGQGATARPNCEVAWLDSSTTVDDLAQDVAMLMLDPLVEEYYDGVWVENLQVLRYSCNGEYVLHHDGHCRVMTCLYYLNGVGGTWFPLANHNDHSSKATTAPASREEALSQELVPGRDGLVFGDEEVKQQHHHAIAVDAGDAVVFYNYLMTPSGATEDWRTLHAGLPATDTKWIANHWFHVGNE